MITHDNTDVKGQKGGGSRSSSSCSPERTQYYKRSGISLRATRPGKRGLWPTCIHHAKGKPGGKRERKKPTLVPVRRGTKKNAPKNGGEGERSGALKQRRRHPDGSGGGRGHNRSKQQPDATQDRGNQAPGGRVEHDARGRDKRRHPPRDHDETGKATTGRKDGKHRRKHGQHRGRGRSNHGTPPRNEERKRGARDRQQGRHRSTPTPSANKRQIRGAQRPGGKRKRRQRGKAGTHSHPAKGARTDQSQRRSHQGRKRQQQRKGKERRKKQGKEERREREQKKEETRGTTTGTQTGRARQEQAQ